LNPRRNAYTVQGQEKILWEQESHVSYVEEKEVIIALLILNVRSVREQENPVMDCLVPFVVE
jgi:hypothetical protein